MRAGTLRHIVSIQARDTAQESVYGSQGTTWTEVYGNVPVAITPLTGKEREIAMAIFPDSQFEIDMRYLPGLTVSHRIVYGTRIFDILNIDNIDERNRELVLTCKEGTTQG
jgi:SPP1 family predicted phage head-tail adaptor